MVLTAESKNLYNEFKAFKNIYTSINISEGVYFLANNLGGINLLFSQDSVFYSLFGEWRVDTEFSKWLQHEKYCVYFELSEINQISKCLKKNAVSVEFEGRTCKFEFNDKDGNLVVIKKGPINLQVQKSIEARISQYNQIPMKTVFLEDKYFEDDIFEVFLKDEKEVALERTDDKLLEIPSDRIKSKIKNSNATISFSELTRLNNRYVKLSFTSEELSLTLNQMFLTI